MAAEGAQRGNINIRAVRPVDADEMSHVLREIIRLTGRSRPSDPAFVLEQYIANPAGIQCSVAVDEAGAIVGFQSLIRATAGNRYDVPEGWGVIGTHIGPDAHRRGVGRSLFAVSLRAAQDAEINKIDAYISADNPGALRYYEAMGFRTYRTTNGIVQKCCVVEPTLPR